MTIKTTLKEWKEAPKYSEIKKDLLSGRSPQELIKLRAKCIEGRKYQRYTRLWAFSFMTVMIWILAVFLAIHDGAPEYLLLGVLFSCLLVYFVGVNDGPQESIIRSIDEELREKWEH